MLRFKYGNIYTQIEVASEAETSEVRKLLSVYDKKTDTWPSFLRSDFTFLTGLLDRVTTGLLEAGLDFFVEDYPVRDDVTTLRIESGILEGIDLYPEYQVPAVRKALWRKRGNIEVPTGGGKTEIAAAILRHLDEFNGLRTVMVVPGVNSMHQTWRRWVKRGIESVGRYGDGKKELGEAHLVAVIDSLRSGVAKRDKKLLNFLDDVGCIMFMEAQHVPADTWMDVGTHLDVEYRIGLSATPWMDDSGPGQVRDLQLIGVTGETVAAVSDAVVMNLGRMATPIVHFMSAGSEWLGGETDWNRIRKVGLVKNATRNQMIKDMATRLSSAGRKVLVLATEIGHGKMIASGVSAHSTAPAFMFQGGSKFTTFSSGVVQRVEKKPVYEVADQLEELDSGYTLVGSPAVDEDADFPDADVLIVCSAGRSFKKIVQRAGRVLRQKPEPNVAHIIDFQDQGSFVLKAQSNRRREMYVSRYSGAERFTVIEHEHIDHVVEAILGPTTQQAVGA